MLNIVNYFKALKYKRLMHKKSAKLPFSAFINCFKRYYFLYLLSISLIIKSDKSDVVSPYKTVPVDSFVPKINL